MKPNFNTLPKTDQKRIDYFEAMGFSSELCHFVSGPLFQKIKHNSLPGIEIRYIALIEAWIVYNGNHRSDTSCPVKTFKELISPMTQKEFWDKYGKK